MWTWLLVTSAMLHGGARTGTISVPSKKPLPTAPCRCFAAPPPFIVGTRIDSQYFGLTFADALNCRRQWKVRLHGAFSILNDVLGLRLNDHRCHHEVWLHLDFAGWHDVQPQREKHCERILQKERLSPYHHSKKSGRISDSMSDHAAFFVTSWPFTQKRMWSRDQRSRQRKKGWQSVK